MDQHRDALISFFLRTGLVVVFLYAAISSFLDPVAWEGFLPQWLRLLIPAAILLPLFSIYELVLAGWLLSSKKTFYAAILGGLTLLVIIVSNISALDIVFRDLAIFFSALALVVVHWHERPGVRKHRR